MTEPKPCFICGKTPIVGSFPLMDMRHLGWTCLCQSRCYETDTYLERDDAVEAWNAWVDAEGDDDWDEEWDEP